ncbi:MAG TPA: hypothetical protein VFE20_06470 [Thermoleophilia bacterium]|nr:hypothetical protein [Thermoleophilia bacterium]
MRVKRLISAALLASAVLMHLTMTSVVLAGPGGRSESGPSSGGRAESGPPGKEAARGPAIGRVRGHPQKINDRWVRGQETYYIEMREGTAEESGRLLGSLSLVDPERSTATVWIEPAYFGWYKPPAACLGGGVYQSEMSITYTGRSYLGNKLWAYTHTVEWEWNGSQIVGGRSNPTASVYAVFWRCQNARFNQWSFGGKGFSSWRRGWQGDFRDVVAGYMIQQVLPWIEFTVYRDGSVSWAKGT